MTEFGQPTPGEKAADTRDYPWYTRLFRWFQRDSHPITDDRPDEDPPPGDAASQQRQYEEWWNRQFELTTNRAERYRIFSEMDQFGDVAAVLDVLAEESTQTDYEKGKSVWIESRHGQMVEAGQTCLDNLMVEDRLFAVIRRMAMWGDNFRRLIYDTGKGVLGWKYAPAAQMHRVEDKYDRLVGFMQDGKSDFRGERKHKVSWPWDYVHFRLLGKDDDSLYGSSAIAPLFRPWRRLTLAEDADLLYTLRRSGDRNLIMVDTGDLDDVEAAEKLNDWRSRLRRGEHIDPSSPDYKKNYKPQSPAEDIFMAVRGPEDQTRVESLAGSPSPMPPERMDYYVNSFFGAAKLPKAFFGREGEINAKATLVQQDMRAARTIKRIQKAGVYGLRNALDIHFMLFSENPEENKYHPDKNPYLVMMSPISYLDEWDRLELVQLRQGVVDALAGLGQSLQMNPKAWATYVLINYAKLPEDVVRILLRKGDSAAPPEGGEVPPGGDFGAGGAPPPPGGGFPPESVNGGHGRYKPRSLLTETSRRLQKQFERRHGRDDKSRWSDGYYDLKPGEERLIAEAIHNSPKLRQLVGDIAAYHEDDFRLADQQTDPSILPPRVYDGRAVYWSDSVENTPEAQKLLEHLASQGGAPVNG